MYTKTPTTESPRVNIETFEAKLLENEVASAHKEALASNKLGGKLVGKTVKLIEKGEARTRVRSQKLAYGVADHDSTTLALNAELKAQNIPVRASVKQEWTGGGDDSGKQSILVIDEVHNPVAITDSQE